MKDEARRQLATMAIALAAVAGTLAAIYSSHPNWLFFLVAITVVTAVAAMALEVTDVRTMLEGRLHRPMLRRSHAKTPVAVTSPAPVPLPSPAFTEKWTYTSDGHQAQAAMRAGELVVPGTGYRVEHGERPPWIRFVVVMSCTPISDDADAADLGLQFVGFLKAQPVTSLVNSLTRPVPGVKWTRWSTRRAGTVDALYTPGKEQEAVAAARLVLPDRTPRFLGDQRRATLILHFEPPKDSGNHMTPAGPVSWTDHMTRALELPATLNRFLTDWLGLSTSADPPAVLGFRLEAPNDLAELLDVTDLKQLPGGHHGREAIGYFTASPEGAPAAKVVDRMISDVLLYGLQAER